MGSKDLQETKFFKAKKRTWSHKSVLALLNGVNGEEEPETIIKRRAREEVQKAFKYKWTGPPFDPKTLASIIGITVEEAKTSIRADARIYPKSDGTLLIEYDPNSAIARINFSICHEIAHTFFPDWIETVRYRNNRSNDEVRDLELESLCDLGAAELLMPHESFEKNVANGMSIKDLKTAYIASTEAIFIRVSQFSQMPCAAVFLSEKLKPTQKRTEKNLEFDFGFESTKPKLRIDYAFPSLKFKEFLPPNKSVPDNSVCYQALQSSDFVEGFERWEIGNLETYKISAVQLPVFVPENPRRVAVLIMPT